jgi:prepilin-type N-terminal cleavage/methylation domain-containing protein
MQARKKHGKITAKMPFTLVELMVVLIIIGILMAALAPAFNRLMTGNAVGAAARMLSSQLSLARSEAVSQRKYIAVIMPGEKFKFKSPAADTNLYHYQSFRAAIVESSAGSNDFKFEKWVQGTTWTFLPVGAVIAEAKDKANGLDQADPDSPRPINNPDNWDIDGTAYHKIKDFPDVDGEYVRAIVFKPNGRCHSKLYLTIMEGVVLPPTAPPGIVTILGNSIERANKSNIKVMEINAFTGQIRHLF